MAVMESSTSLHRDRAIGAALDTCLVQLGQPELRGSATATELDAGRELLRNCGTSVSMVLLSALMTPAPTVAASISAMQHVERLSVHGCLHKLRDHANKLVMP